MATVRGPLTTRGHDGHMSQKSPFVNPPVESLSALNFLWEDELIKETDEP